MYGIHEYFNELIRKGILRTFLTVQEQQRYDDR